MVGMVNDVGKAASDLAGAEKKLSDANAAAAAAKQKADDKKCTDGDTTCASEKKTLDDASTGAKKKADEALGERNAMRDLHKATLDTAAKASAESASVIAGGGLTGRPDEKVAKRLFQMQKEFVRRDPSQSLIEACLVELSNGRNDARPGVVDNMFSLGIAPAVSEGGLQSNNATGALIGSRLAYQSGLYEYCVKNLAGFANSAREARLQTELQAGELEAKELAVRDMEARATTAKAYSDSLTKCGAIQSETLKGDCVQSVLSLKGKPVPDDGKPGAAPAPSTASGDATLPASPVFRFIVATDAVAKLGKATTNFPAPTDPIDPSRTNPENEGRLKEIKTQLGDLGKKKAGVDTEIGKHTKAAQQALESAYVEARATVAVAADEKARKRAQAKLGVAEVELIQAADELAAIESGADAARLKYDGLRAVVNKFNEDVKVAPKPAAKPAAGGSN
jgi:hypothetical protein